MKLPLKPPDLNTLLTRETVREKIGEIFRCGATVRGKYLHWDQLRHREPPVGLGHEEWWLGVKMARSQSSKTVPLLRDKGGNEFGFVITDDIFRRLHQIDQNASGRVRMSEEITNPDTRDRYIINSLIEESVTSSQLEGASTTVDVAKNMIRSGRKPTDRSEQMILNNYQAMRLVCEFEGPLTAEKVVELHRVVTEDALDDPEMAGQFRSEDDSVTVTDGMGTTLHVPPAAHELPERLGAMCDFANERTQGPFIHPVVRAMILHFWLAYDHPFVDGNGRTARALFYWSMLSQGYWLTEFLSISRILKKAPAQYSRSFLYTETDGNDLTYFLEYQLRVLQRAIAELQKYLARKVAQVREVEAMMKESADLNHRQLALLSHALRHPGQRYTIASHRMSHRVVYQTARTDLLDLADRGLLMKRKSGRSYVFTAPTNLGTRLRELHKPSSS